MKFKTIGFGLKNNLSLIAALLALGATPVGSAQPAEASKPGVVTLPEMAVYSRRVALQEPSAGAFAMPVSALAFEPLVDVHARNMGESQADISIRGGIFENTGFRAGAAPLHDPQTGHYSAEIPIAPAMLAAPDVLTGADNAFGGWNANAGTIAYQWRRITTSGMVTAAGGDYDTVRGEIYQGWVAPESARAGGRRLAFDAAAAWAQSDGSQSWGESRFSRYNARAQLAGDGGQTDLFFGRQGKFIGWPNLYTPYANVFETDDLRTTLVTLNHFEKLKTAHDGDYVTAGVAWRRNDDHYVFNRADSGAHNPAFGTSPSTHSTRAWSAGAEARVSTGRIRWRTAANFVADEIESTSLIYGRFNSRSHIKASLAPEREWAVRGGAIVARAGVSYDDTNRGGAAWSPLASVEWRGSGGFVEKLHLSWTAASQTPNYTALNANAGAGLFRGNPDLGREKSSNIEAGARVSRGAWTLDAAVFFRRDDDLVDWVYSEALPNARAASAVDIDTYGVELTARFTAGWGGLVFGYTAMGKDADYGAAGDAGLVDASFYALNYARHRLTAAVVARPWRGWEIRLDNEARIQKANTLRRSGDEALLTSAGVFYTPTISGWHGLRFFAQMTNAWDSDFEDVPSVPAARRQWCAGMACAW